MARLRLSTVFALVRYERQAPHYKKIGAKDRDGAHEGVPLSARSGSRRVGGTAHQDRCRAALPLRASRLAHLGTSA